MTESRPPGGEAGTAGGTEATTDGSAASALPPGYIVDPLTGQTRPMKIFSFCIALTRRRAGILASSMKQLLTEGTNETLFFCRKAKKSSRTSLMIRQ